MRNKVNLNNGNTSVVYELYVYISRMVQVAADFIVNIPNSLEMNYFRK